MMYSIDNLVLAGATLGAAAIGGLFAWLSARSSSDGARKGERLRALESKHRRALEQLESYHVLEGLYAAELEMLSSGSEKALRIKTEFRNRVETQNFVRPTMTALEARHELAALTQGGSE